MGKKRSKKKLAKRVKKLEKVCADLRVRLTKIADWVDESNTVLHVADVKMAEFPPLVLQALRNMQDLVIDPTDPTGHIEIRETDFERLQAEIDDSNIAVERLKGRFDLAKAAIQAAPGVAAAVGTLLH